MDRNMAAAGLEADLSELEGRTYACIDGCALCCLCQPELLPDEERAFRDHSELSAGVVSTHISQDVKGAALKLQGSHGACHFLSDRRCSIYDRRPHYCRSFPLNVYVGRRIQVNANMSCRGLDLPGDDLRGMGAALLSEYGNERLVAELASANEVFELFEGNAREAAVAQSFDSVRQATEMLMDELTDMIGLSRVMTFAEYGGLQQNSSSGELVKAARRAEAEADVRERALIDGVELFDLAHMSHLPVYVGPDLSWKIFKLEGRQIAGWNLDESGDIDEFCRLSPADVDLLPMTADGRRALTEYAGMVNRRDCFLGHAAYLCDVEGYEYNFGQVYLGTMANSVIDLWWRASLLALLSDAQQLGRSEVREGVAFFDMDLLDLPTIGAFI